MPSLRTEGIGRGIHEMIPPPSPLRLLSWQPYLGWLQSY
jgi:hypothetical protein